ncbi:peptide-methionine (R)-S-oxide reductase MsrB [Psychrobium sp. 1_MG-2023]|uniref:peptide-methionine (R)-S-oxide reductase MsrB n=1 Tax=Psychrobium sp. 1_MG-2023 TaxID=3062624 RepID=UPI000C32B127|nr:peptide-methionine (R)-S-oxide reductase MsrB [Psychrobium sp. 1_MG-2023]MDP2561012.1 peptide-methionine (R)-S-oxide reductase MsrB [Psychrobium sp. 1_MG-2023]PKF58306.1 peptide-methionine (R)-S-oxide reductase [Alteromonadales bacterium alter-6D02]
MKDQQWREKLTPEQYYVCREKGTERPFTGQWLTCKESGQYKCICCDSVLFEAGSQFDSGCGWPSFDDVAGNKAVTLHRDSTHGMERTEVCCANCDAHLGHVFNDGPTATGLRYCINSVAIDYQPD